MIATNDQGNLWRHSDFMKLWAGATISRLGSDFTGLALPIIGAVALNATPMEMGILSAAPTSSTLLISLFAGVWVDSQRRRSILIAADAGRALILATVPAAAIAGMLSIYQLYIVGITVGVLTVFFDVAHQAYLPSLVDRTRLVEANSKLQMGYSTAHVAGLSLAGLIIQTITAPMAIALDTLSYLASALLVWRIRRVEAAPTATVTAMLAQVREGLGFVLRDRSLRAMAGCNATSNFCSGAFFSLLILFATRELGLEAPALGFIFGVGPIGALLAAMLASRAAGHFGLGTAIVGGAFFGGLEMLPVAFATPGTAVPLLLLSGLLGHFAWVVCFINQAGARQAITPLALQGRMSATMRFIVLGVEPLGAVAGGALAQVLGLRVAITIAALVSLVSFLWVLFSPIRGLTSVPELAK